MLILEKYVYLNQKNTMKKLLFIPFLFLSFLKIGAQEFIQNKSYCTESKLVKASLTFNPVGDWLFDDPQQLLSSSVGTALELVGSHTSVSGPSVTDAAARIGVGSHYKLTHGIPPNNGALVNTYSIRFDFKVNNIANWHTFLQTNDANSDDGELFIDQTGHIGVSATGYSTQVVKAGSWNRLVVVVNNGVEYSLYLNAIKILAGTIQDIDGRFALNPTLILFGDNDGEDGEMDVARVSLYNRALTQSEVQSLGGYEQSTTYKKPFLTLPYLQNATTNSVTVMWESEVNTQGTVNYGTTSAYGNSVTSTVIPINANTFVHKAIIPSLQEATKYYYQVICNDVPNPEQSFKTATTDVNASFKVGIWGDSHNLNPFSSMASYLVNNLRPDFCVTTGDISTNDGNIYSDLQNVFIPVVLGTIGTKVPFYEGFGNHDVWNGNFIREFVSQPSLYNSDAAAVSGSYAYVYGNSVFITIDWSRYSTDLAPNGWLETFLKSPISQQAKFRFIFIHCPPFIERWQVAEQQFVKTNIPLLSKKYGVNAVFSGHMHGYERGVLDGVQYITQGGASYMDVNEAVGPTIYSHIIVGTNKANLPANFNNGLTNHLLTLEITPTTATSKLHYFDGSGNYQGVIESVEMSPRSPESLNDVSSPSELRFSISPNPTKGILSIKAPESFDVDVFNLQGKKVFGKIEMSPDNDLDLSSLTQGAYLVKLKAGKTEFTKTIVISAN